MLHLENTLLAQVILLFEKNGITQNEHFHKTLIRVSEQTGIGVERILSISKQEEVVYARYLWYTLLHKEFGFSISVIASTLQKHHTTVAAGIYNITNSCKTFLYVKEDLEALGIT